MLKKIFVITTIIMFLPKLSFAHTDDFGKEPLKQMPYVSYSQSNLIQSRTKLCKIGIGFGVNQSNDGIDKSKTPDSLFSRKIRKIDGDFKFFEFGLGFKLYDNPNLSDTYFDFSLTNFKVELITNNLTFSAAMTLINKSNKLYSMKDIEWVGLGYSIGYELLNMDNSLMLYPEASLRFGIRTFKFDTVNVPNYNLIDNSTQLNFGGIDFNLTSRYKSLKLQYQFMLNGMNNGITYSNGIIFTYDYRMGKFSLLSLFLNYNNEKIEISPGSNSSGKKLINSFTSINFGITVHPMAFFAKY